MDSAAQIDFDIALDGNRGRLRVLTLVFLLHVLLVRTQVGRVGQLPPIDWVYSAPRSSNALLTLLLRFEMSQGGLGLGTNRILVLENNLLDIRGPYGSRHQHLVELLRLQFVEVLLDILNLRGRETQTPPEDGTILLVLQSLNTKLYFLRTGIVNIGLPHLVILPLLLARRSLELVRRSINTVFKQVMGESGILGHHGLQGGAQRHGATGLWILVGHEVIDRSCQVVVAFGSIGGHSVFMFHFYYK